MNFKLILASNSPRRQQIMRECGLRFDIRVKEVDEDFPADLPAREVARYLAEKKGKAYQQEIAADELVITADTTVLIHEQVLNKPANEEEARQMIRLLSGQVHEVITGVCISRQQELHSFDERTKVKFRKLDEEEISYYVNHYRPLDKAGAYAIQEWIGMVGIERIEGSYFNVMGLPINRLYTYLKEIGVARLG
ncbi:MAG: Maf family nucleotide pyrophosphatase [Cyclobacteriaceae bacterium]